jgi:hypothetical protein
MSDPFSSYPKLGLLNEFGETAVTASTSPFDRRSIKLAIVAAGEIPRASNKAGSS